VTTLISGTFCHLQVGTSVFNPRTKFEVSTITCYEDIKGNAKCSNCGRLGATQSHRQCRHSMEYIRLFNRLHTNYASIFYRFRVIASYLSKVANFNLPHLHFAPPLGVTPVGFCRDYRLQETRVPGLSCGVVCVVQRLAVSVEHRLVTDGQTHDDS